jgi:transcriptional regulator with XRE-family HTH domain
MKSINEKIRLLRQQKGWSQGDIASQLGITTAGYSKIETGVTDVNMSRVEQIAKLYEISVLELLAYGEFDDPEHYRTELHSVSTLLVDQKTTLDEILQRLGEVLIQLKKNGNHNGKLVQ